jgi:hypothetical protein
MILSQAAEWKVLASLHDEKARVKRIGGGVAGNPFLKYKAQ